MQTQQPHIRFVHLIGHNNSRLIADRCNAEYISVLLYNKNIHIGKYVLRTQLLSTMAKSFMKMISTKKRNCTAYFTSGLLPIFMPIFMRKLKREKNTIILRANDATFNVVNKRGTFIQWCYRRLFKEIDGVVAVSPMIAEDARKELSCPVYHSIPPNWRGSAYFADIRPDLSSNTFIFLGEYVPVKGIDILAKVMRIIHEQTGAKTIFIGLHIEQGLRKKGLHHSSFEYTGFANPKDHFGKGTFIIHLARYEASGTGVLEGMAAGLIPIVSEGTGNKSYVHRLDPELVVPKQHPEVIAAQIIRKVQSLSEDNMRQLSEQARTLVQECEPDLAAEDFIAKMELIAGQQ